MKLKTFISLVLITINFNALLCLKLDTKQLYLDIMKKILINTIYEDFSTFPDKNKNKYNKEIREEGKDWPAVAHTMVGLKRLDNIQYCVENVLKNKIPGDLVETGVWRGGSTIFMRAILKAYNINDRNVWVVDSFQGLPKSDEKNYPADKGMDWSKIKELSVSLETVKSNFLKYDLLDDQVKFLKGWFKDTLPSAPIEKIAVLRLDGDMYESTMDSLNNLYAKVLKGGFVIVDDWCVPACVKAVNDFRRLHNITDPIIKVDFTGVYWQKTQ